MKESKSWRSFCIDPTQIEGYERAISDPSKTRYECHHRLETHTSDGIIRSVPLSMAELKALDMYYHRPAEELVILTAREHAQLHRLTEGKNNYASKEEAKAEHTEYMKQWYEEHAEYKKQWRKEHQAEQAEYNKQWREDHAEYSKQWEKEHQAERAEYHKQYYEANREYYRRQSKVSGWIKRNPTSTNFPKAWDEEDIKIFYKLSK